jgi:hypothetical protein
MEKETILTGKCLAEFIRWASKRQNFNYNKHTKTLTYCGKSFFDLPQPMQHSAIMVFGDEAEICIHIEPYLGGGQPAYFASILYRNKDFIDMQLDVDNKGSAEFWTRFEATQAAIKEFNILYNNHPSTPIITL